MTHRAIVPFKRWHAGWLLDEGASADGYALDWPLEALRQMEGTRAWTAQVDGHPVACGGLVEHWPGRYQAWAFMNHRTGPFMRWLTKETRAKFDEVEGRIEMTVRREYGKGHRWARMLGFAVETPVLQRFGPEGEDHTGYVLLKGGQ